MIHTPAYSIKSKIDKFGHFKGFSFQKLLLTLFKRTFDFTVALIGLLILSPIFAIIAILIKRDSPGPVFYWGTRMGKGERQFRMLKFRTMYECPSSYEGPQLTCKEDERITPLGHWLRDTKVNELPQLWNVLIGEMSLVGPRPEDPAIAQNWTQAARREILSIRPGITSPASILYHDEERLLSQTDLMGNYFNSILPDKLRLDQLYVRNKSFFSDLDIIFWTLVVIIPRLAKMKIPEGYLFAGLFSRIAHRYVSWFLLDLLTSLVVVVFVNLLWRTQGPLNWGVEHLAILAVVLALLFSGVNSIVGLNRIVWSRATTEDAINLAISCGVVTLFILILNLLQSNYHWIPFPPLPAAMIFTIGIMAQLGFMVMRYRWRLLTSIASRWLTLRRNFPGVGEKVLIVGAGEGCQTANWLLKRKGFSYAYTIVGIVDDDLTTNQGMLVEGCRVLGRIADIPDLVKKFDVGMVLFTIQNIVPELKEHFTNLCKNLNVRLVFLDSLMGMVDQQLTQPVTPVDSSTQLQARPEFVAMHDELTGLPNRFLFEDRLRQSLAYAKRYKTQLAVITIGLDGFKTINEPIENGYRDEALKEITKHLLHCKRECDTLARLEGDKFALILENISNETTAEKVAQRIFTSISGPFKVIGQDFVTSVNIGICMGMEFFDDPELFKQADSATYYVNTKKVESSNWQEYE